MARCGFNCLFSFFSTKKDKITWGDMATYEDPQIIALYKLFPDLQDQDQLHR